MVARIVGDKRRLEEVCRDIIERADGVPLFAEEIAKAAVEATGEGGAERVLAGVPSPVDAVPASLHASLMSRLDRLGAAIQDRPGTAKVRPKQTYTIASAIRLAKLRLWVGRCRPLHSLAC